MASDLSVRLHEPSAYAEGFGTCRTSPSATGAGHAAVRIASAHSELATLRGNHAVQSTSKHLTEALLASQPAAFSVRVSTLLERGEARG